MTYKSNECRINISRLLFNQVGDITSSPMRCMIIIRHMRQVHNRCKNLIWFSMWCHILLLPNFINHYDEK